MIMKPDSSSNNTRGNNNNSCGFLGFEYSLCVFESAVHYNPLWKILFLSSLCFVCMYACVCMYCMSTPLCLFQDVCDIKEKGWYVLCAIASPILDLTEPSKNEH